MFTAARLEKGALSEKTAVQRRAVLSPHGLASVQSRPAEREGHDVIAIVWVPSVARVAAVAVIVA